MTPRALLFLPALARFADAALLALRLITGGFLVWAMWPNISNAETMREVIGYFAASGFVWPEFFAPLSAWAQFAIGIALILGLLTRWTGLLLAFNFTIGMIMVHWHDSFRDQWPALSLLFIGLLLATTGGGRFAIDRRIETGRR